MTYWQVIAVLYWVFHRGRADISSLENIKKIFAYQVVSYTLKDKFCWYCMKYHSIFLTQIIKVYLKELFLKYLIKFSQPDFVFQCVFIYLYSCCTVSPTHRLLQLLHERRHMKFNEWYEMSSLELTIR